MKPVGVLTVAPWHHSIGDIATAECTVNYLSRRGIPSVSVHEPDDRYKCLVIGGGNLLYGGTARPWRRLQAVFQEPGPHVLNAVGIDLDSFDRIDWSFLDDFRLISVRDDRLRDALARRLPNREIVSVPCPATLVEPLPYRFLRQVPGLEGLRTVPSRSYVVLHRHPAVERFASRIAMPAVVVDAQVWERHPWGAGGYELLPTHSPAVLQGIISSARAVVSNSLHICIFALAAGTPFAAIDTHNNQSRKVRCYMERAGIPEVMFSSDRSDDPVEYAIGLSRSIRAAARSERRLAEEHLDRVAEAVSTV
jgi:hypothetical protein